MPPITLTPDFVLSLLVALAAVIGSHYANKAKAERALECARETEKESVERTNGLRTSLEAEMQELKAREHERDRRVSSCETATQLTAQEIQRLTRVAEQLTIAVSKLTEEVARQNERERLRGTV